MKKYLLIASLALCSQITFAQTETKKDKDKHENHEPKKTAWAELDAYHTVMSQTFHPAENGDLKPLLAKSQELADKAKVLANSTVPEKYQKKDVGAILKKLEQESLALHQMVTSKKSDEEIKKAIFALHDRFHEVMEKCNH
jgi:hypothetical protein